MTTHPFEQDEAGIVTETRKEVRRPPLYKVLLHNDDYTTMDFVVFVLQAVFHHDEETAYRIMMHVHTRGIGIAGLYPYEVAEAKVEQVQTLAREHEFPLRCSIEPE
jgi:ATP-dependent Clp protease adaptor protein ClpS